MDNKTDTLQLLMKPGGEQPGTQKPLTITLLAISLKNGLCTLGVSVSNSISLTPAIVIYYF